MLNPLWRKAPTTYLRFPGLFAALMGGIGLLTFILVAYPLFMSATENRLLRSTLLTGTVTRYGAGLHYEATNLPIDTRATSEPRETGDPDVIDEAFRSRTSTIEGLGEPVTSIMGPEVGLSSDADDRMGRLMFRDGWQDHVEIVDGRTSGPGVWLSDLTTRGLGIDVGDEVRITYRNRDVAQPVAGIYRALYSQPPSGYWRNFGRQIFIQCADCAPPPPFVLAERSHFEDVATQLRVQNANFDWDAPLETSRISIDRAEAIDAAFDRIARDAAPGGELASKMSCCASRPFDFSNTALTSSIDEAMSQVNARITSLEAPGWVVLIATVLVALFAIAGIGVYSVVTRTAEYRLLFARGTGGGVLLSRAVLEAILPAIAGSITGVVAAVTVVRLARPGEIISSSALSAAAIAAVVAAVGAVWLLALSVRGMSSRSFGLRFHRHIKLPWEVVTSVGAFAAFLALQSRGEVTGNGNGAPSMLLLLFPLAVIGTGAGIVSRAMQSAFGALTSARIRSNVLYIAVHRLGGAAAVAKGLAAGCGVAVGVFVLAMTLAGSLDRTLDAKARVFVGSDVAAAVPSAHELPVTFPHPSTKVIRITDVEVLDAGSVVDLVAIDRDTLGRAAYWDEAFGATSLEDAIEPLDDESSGAMPVLVAGEVPLSGSLDLDAHGTVLNVSVQDQLTAFPGMLSKRPLVVIDIDEFTARLEEDGSELLSSFEATSEHWIRGDPDRVRGDLLALRDQPYSVTAVDEVKDLPSLSAIIEAFRVMTPLALTALAAVVIALLTYLQSRMRSGSVGYAFSLRMGLRKNQHAWALFTEIATILVIAYAFATVLALVAAWATASFIDPLPTVPPETIIGTPLRTLTVGGAGVVFVAGLGALIVNRTAARSNVAELLRTSE